MTKPVHNHSQFSTSELISQSYADTSMCFGGGGGGGGGDGGGGGEVMLNVLRCQLTY